MPSKENVRKRIREIRKQKGITQKDLADKMGISQSGVAALENSTDNITIGTINKVAEALEVHPVDLLMDIDHISANAETLEQMGFSWEDLQILEDFQKLNDDGQHEAIKRTHELTLIDIYRK